MSAAGLTLRIILATIILIVITVTGAIGFMLIEPFAAALGPPAALGWDDPAGTAVVFAGVGFAGLLLVLVVWFIAAPIRSDQRQQFR